MEDPTQDKLEEIQETWADQLEGQAKEIVESESPRLCVQAGPGTGKSFCMTRRLLRLIQQKKVKPSEILAVTFTRTAANDLRRELEKTLGEAQRGFRASTLHSLCFNIVEHESFLKVRNRKPRFLLSVTKQGCLNFEAAPMLSDLQAENSAYKAAREQSKKIKEFEAMWARRQTDPLGTPAEGQDAPYGTSVLNWLRFHQGMLVGELVKEAYEFLSAEPDSPWRTKFRAILVDEYQDLNKLDQAMIDLLCEHEQTVASVVGDVDQSIYSFRCAHPEGLVEYATKNGVEAKTMDTSRRCGTAILSPAQNLIKQNTKHASAYPSPMSGMHAGSVYVRRWATRTQEVEGVVAFIKHCKNQGVEEGEILVLVPSRVIGKDIRNALRAEDIPAHSYFAEEQLEEVEAQKAFTLLTLLANQKDRVALRCWLGGWKNGHCAGSYKKLRRYCEENNAEPWDTLEMVVSGDLSLSGTNPLYKPFEELKEKLASLTTNKGPSLLDSLFPTDAEWAEDIRVLASQSICDETSAADLHEMLVEAITQPFMPAEVDHVRIMSFHKSKGLTCEAAAIMGAIDGLAPRPHDPEKSFLTPAEHIEEQRRLFYVAMTRSKNYLLISSANVVGSQFVFGVPIVGKWLGRGRYQTAVSPFVTSLGTALPAASNGMTFS
ncbi:MAG: ATP-dependent helicase [Fimbriimonadales bacterium]|nr:ATP-dependent helicase [Fimbriimonadales bacterium]